jgi:uncharacterized protein YjbI with pentapeptide repeats
VQRLSIIRSILQSIFVSKRGGGGAAIVLLGIVWKALDVWQTADFLPSRMTFLAGVLDSFLGPLILVAIGAFFIYRQVALRWPVIQELEVQERRRGEDALDSYFDRMQQWVLDTDKPLADSQPGDQRRTLARTRTLAILQRLDPNGKRDVLQFLREHGLISGDTPVLRLHAADLSNANLADLALIGTNLNEVNLSGADLSCVQMCGFAGNSASWGKAIERGGGPEDLMQPLTPAKLSGANLSDAILTRTTLAGCNLIGANFAGADLDRADLRAADLREARNLTPGQIEQAYGSSGQQDYMPDTLLPDNRSAPQAWEKLLSQQQSERNP